jgi:mRNA interferase HigB
VRIIARSTLNQFIDSLSGHRDQPAVKAALDTWFHEVKRVKWKTSADIKARYTTASIVDSTRVVFNVKGNSYRMVASINYEQATVYIKWLGTHKEYGKIDVRTVQYASKTN